MLSDYAGTNSFADRINQFTNFISSLFFSSPGGIVYNEIVSYQLDIPNNINYIGVILLVLMIISFIVNRKEKIAQLSFGWVVFSIVILFVIGWGMPENGLILYSLYFAWAYLILFFLLIKKIFKKEKIFKIIMSLSIVIMFLFSFRELLNIIAFAVKFY